MTSDTSGTNPHIAIIGGGAAGFFCAMTAAEENPDTSISIFEKGKKYLGKVRVSGGGRCNVTHSCFDPGQLATHYPRGSRELRGAFHRWQPQDTIDWFSHRGVDLKTEEDGRIFPVSDDSQTIIDCFMKTAREAGIHLYNDSGLKSITRRKDGSFELDMGPLGLRRADKVCLACGSLKSSPLTNSIEAFGHAIEPMAPSLFAFNVSDKRIHGLSGLSVPTAKVKTSSKGSAQMGPMLITHRGFSGPAILRLSAWEARSLQQQDYQFELSVNWLGNVSINQVQEEIFRLRKSSGKALVKNRPIGDLPRRLWERLIEVAGISAETPWAQLPKNCEEILIRELVDGCYKVQGKTTNKDEFVTCGGVRLKEVDFRSMESRIVPGLHFAGECLDIDGITGGFNFQAAWTSGRIAGLAMARQDSGP